MKKGVDVDDIFFINLFLLKLDPHPDVVQDFLIKSPISNNPWPLAIGQRTMNAFVNQEIPHNKYQ